MKNKHDSKHDHMMTIDIYISHVSTMLVYLNLLSIGKSNKASIGIESPK